MRDVNELVTAFGNSSSAQIYPGAGIYSSASQLCISRNVTLAEGPVVLNGQYLTRVLNNPSGTVELAVLKITFGNSSSVSVPRGQPPNYPGLPIIRLCA